MNANKRKILEDAGILYPSVVTNADRIRAMSDEEMAEFLERVADGCNSCPILKECTYLDGEMSEEQVRLIWLKEEVSNDE